MLVGNVICTGLHSLQFKQLVLESILILKIFYTNPYIQQFAVHRPP